MLLVNDLSRRTAKYRELIHDALERVIASGWLVLGPEVRYFEQSFAAYLGTPHCVGVGNGTEAIQLALCALGIEPGQRVATAANAGMYTSTALFPLGAVPWFMDVDPQTQCVSLSEVRRAVGAGVKAVVVTHLFGMIVPEIEDIAAYCVEQGVPLVEDCAQAHGARLGGRCAGNFGDIASFSFYPTKNLGALGDGGAVATRHKELADRVQLLRQYGWATKYRVELAGATNSRLDELQAAVLSALLPYLDNDNRRRREVANRYSAAIVHPEIRVPTAADSGYVAHLYVVRTSRRESLRRHLHAFGVATDVHYPIPDHRQPVFGKVFAEVRLPVTESLVEEILTLPCYPEIGDDEVQRVIDTVNGWTT